MPGQALPYSTQPPGEPSRRSSGIVLRMKALLGERIDRTRETVRANDAEMRLLQGTACREIGRGVKAFLPHVRPGFLRYPSLSEKAALPTGSGIVDAGWYLHGADEGRTPKLGLDASARTA